MIQVIEYKKPVFRLCIDGKFFDFIPVELYNDKSLFPLPKKAKGSTLGWHVCNKFVSYWQIKNAIKNKFKHEDKNKN